MPKVRLELATPGLQTQSSSHWAIQLKSYCWEGVEFIQLVYCIIIYLSFLNCDWLLIREVQWFYWTQKLLVPVEKFTVRMPKVRLELATPGLQTQCSSHWAIQLKSYRWEGVEGYNITQTLSSVITYFDFCTTGRKLLKSLCLENLPARILGLPMNLPLSALYSISSCNRFGEYPMLNWTTIFRHTNM